MKTASLLRWFCVVSGIVCISAYAEKGLDPFIQQATLTASDGAASDDFGGSVAMSSDGNAAIVGAYYADVDGKTNQGAAYVFTRTGTAWIQQVKLVAPDGVAEDNFGYSVAVSGDGQTAIVGAKYANVGGVVKQGAAYVFTRAGAGWNPPVKLTASDGAAEDFFGYSVALSGDGDTAIAGAGFAKVGGNNGQGAAYVFTRSGAAWTQQAKLTASDGAVNEYFGNALAMSSDGNTAIAGATHAAVGGVLGQGAAYVFTRSGAVWTQQTKLTASDGAASDDFGGSVALCSNGNAAIVGAQSADVGGKTNQGAAYVFTRSGADWTQKVKLIASDGAAADYFGGSVALGNDGNIAIAGAEYANMVGQVDQGAAYVFTRSGDFWTQQSKLTATNGNVVDHFGASVALSSDGATLIAGAPTADEDGTLNKGAAYVMTVGTAAVGPQIKANGATRGVIVNYPDPVTITVEMNAGNYAGAPVDWWVIAFSDSAGWLYLNSAMQWTTPNQGEVVNCQPVFMGQLFNLPPATVLNEFVLPRGIYNFWFAVDYPMDGILKLDGLILADKVIVVVQ